MKLGIIVSFISFALVACSGASSPKETHTAPPTVDASTPTVDATSPVDVFVQMETSTSSQDTSTGSSTGSGSGSSSGTGSDSGSGSGSGSSSGSGSGSGSHAEDAGHDAAPPPPCTLPSGTYTYTFVAVTGIQCDNTLASYSVGPAPLGSLVLSTLLPSFCDATGDTTVTSDPVASANGCNASATFTCADPVPATIPDGGSDPLKLVTVSTITSNTGATEMTGTVSLTETDEVNATTCTETYTFTAKQTM